MQLTTFLENEHDECNQEVAAPLHLEKRRGLGGRLPEIQWIWETCHATSVTDWAIYAAAWVRLAPVLTMAHEAYASALEMTAVAPCH